MWSRGAGARWGRLQLRLSLRRGILHRQRDTLALAAYRTIPCASITVSAKTPRSGGVFCRLQWGMHAGSMFIAPLILPPHRSMCAPIEPKHPSSRRMALEVRSEVGEPELLELARDHEASAPPYRRRTWQSDRCPPSTVPETSEKRAHDAPLDYAGHLPEWPLLPNRHDCEGAAGLPRTQERFWARSLMSSGLRADTARSRMKIPQSPCPAFREHFHSSLRGGLRP